MLDLSTFLIKERVAFMKLTDAYDIFDPATGRQVGTAVEKVGPFMKSLRLVVNKALLPTSVEVLDENGQLLFSIRKGGLQLFRSTVQVLGAGGALLGYFRSKILSIGGGFTVFDANDTLIADVKGDWKGWNFRILGTDNTEFGTVSKQWAGLGKELFTSADNYVIALAPEQTGNPATTSLLLAAGLAIDIVYKEKKK